MDKDYNSRVTFGNGPDHTISTGIGEAGDPDDNAKGERVRICFGICADVRSFNEKLLRSGDWGAGLKRRRRGEIFRSRAAV